MDRRLRRHSVAGQPVAVVDRVSGSVLRNRSRNRRSDASGSRLARGEAADRSQCPGHAAGDRDLPAVTAGTAVDRSDVTPIVDIQGLTHRYGPRVAVDDVSFSIVSGASFGLLGPNGGGKSTLFKILATLLTPSKGTARIAGHDVITDRAAVR